MESLEKSGINDKRLINKTYEERLKELGMFSLEKIGEWGGQYKMVDMKTVAITCFPALPSLNMEVVIIIIIICSKGVLC